jgi:hypothetical protein
VHTARRAAASVGQRLDDHVALAADLVAQIGRRRLGERRLGESPQAWPCWARTGRGPFHDEREG